MTDITELAQRMKAAAVRAKAATEDYVAHRMSITVCLEECKEFNDLSDGPDNILALVEALELKEEQRANWFQMAQKLGEDLDAAEKRIAELAGNSPVIPDGYVMVPMRLTAKNGAKGALSGEFSETKFVNCPECFGDDECETCDGSGRIKITVPVSWTTIKEIWTKALITSQLPRRRRKVNKIELLQRISALATECHALACDLDIGDERTEMFEIYGVLHNLGRCGYAHQVRRRMNPLLASCDDEEDKD